MHGGGLPPNAETSGVECLFQPIMGRLEETPEIAFYGSLIASPYKFMRKLLMWLKTA